MKKAFLMMAAAAMFFAGCTEKENNEGNTPATPASNNVYEVTVVAVIPECSAPYLMLNLEYTDASGATHNTTFKNGDEAETLSAEVQTAYENIYRPRCTGNNADLKESLFSHYIAKTFKLTVPAGKSFGYKGTVKVISGYTVPTEDFNLIQPMVFSTAKRVSGDSQDYSASAVTAASGIKMNIGVHAEAAENVINGFDGWAAGEASVTLK